MYNNSISSVTMAHTLTGSAHLHGKLLRNIEVRIIVRGIGLSRAFNLNIWEAMAI